MADPRDTRIAELEELLAAAETARQAAEEERDAAETARLAAEEERDAARQVLAFWDALVATVQQRQRGGRQPLTCRMAARLV
jgi:hypothetical protein